MNRMRKGLAALAAAVSFLSVGGVAQAVLGIPDDVPGATLLYPFFKVDPTPTPTSRLDSLIVITNTSNVRTTVHITIWTTNSDHKLDFNVVLTEHDVYSCSLLDLLINPTQIVRPCGTFQAPPSVPIELRVGELLAGYVTADVVQLSGTALFPGEAGYPFLDQNTLIGHLYLVDLPAGSASGFNAVSIESDTTSLFPLLPGAAPRLGHPAVALNGGIPQVRGGFYLNRCIEQQGATAACDPQTGGYGNRERIDGPGGEYNQIGTPLAFPLSVNDSPLSLIVRYFSASVIDGSSEIWLWKDRVTGPSSHSVAVYDEDENQISITISLPQEVNFVMTRDFIPRGVPGGWLRVKFVCSSFGYCDYDVIDPTTWGSAAAQRTPIQAVAYGLNFANSQDATLRWDAAFPAHRQYTNYQGVGE